MKRGFFGVLFKIIQSAVWKNLKPFPSSYCCIILLPFSSIYPVLLRLFTSVSAEGLSGSWKDNGSAGPFTPSSNSSSGGYWSWSAPSDQSNPSTPSPPLSADSFKPFRVPSVGGVGSNPPGVEDPSLDEQDGSSLLFDEPIPRKRKVSSLNQVKSWNSRK